ncbi:MAG: leishmanolysin-related zinc metalloendopeptidase [Microthrixaceae bacterium]
MRARVTSPRRRFGASSLAIGAVLGAAGLLAACGPTPPSATTTTTLFSPTPVPPVINSFTTVGTVSSSPAIVTFGWSVGDANQDPLTCRIDGDGDGVDDVTITNCQQSGSTRNVAISLPPGATTPSSFTARLTVEDGTHPGVVANRTFTIAPGPAESFDIVLRGVDALGPAEAAAFASAEARWEQIITAGIPDFGGDLSGCLPAGTAPIGGTVDDVVIDVAISPLGGVGGVLGQAGPTCVSTSNELTVHGIMTFDSADVPDMIAEGSFEAVVLHEMAHVLGFGTLWDETPFGGVRKVVQGIGGSNPRFSGTRAMAEWSRMGGAGNVPVENTGGSGTVGSHWRESVFVNELMTGWINGGSNPLSRVSVASMGDLGYHVDLSEADAYGVPGFAAARRAAPSTGAEGTIERPPVGRV